MEIALIIEAGLDWTGPSETFAGRRWRVSNNHKATDAFYHCISYTWGPGRAPNLFGLDGNISSQTRSALGAAITSTLSTKNNDNDALSPAFWIDAVCVPREGALRRRTLESMGSIYSSAKSTIVVLQTATWDIISRDARSKEAYTEAQLAQLDEDTWCNSVWTYQEIVNAPNITFTAIGLPPNTPGVDYEDFLNSIGFSLQRYKEQHSLSALELRARYPALDALEDAIADARTAGYMERSMLTCLTGIEGRYCDPARPTNRLYALLGAFTQEPSWADDGSADESVAELAEKCMRICDAKGDFSYIYTSDSRRGEVGLKWRPRAELGLRPVVKWHCWGERQEGTLTDGKLELRQMVKLDLRDEQAPDVARDILKWLRGLAGQSMVGEGLTTIDEVENVLPDAFRSIGFTGSAICHRCTTGIILTQDEVGPREMCEAYASGSISWVFGAPGIAKLRAEGTGEVWYTVIIYVGLPLSRATKQSVVLDC